MSPKKLDIHKSIERELAEPKVPGKKPVPGQPATSKIEKLSKDSEKMEIHAGPDSFSGECEETENVNQPVTERDDPEVAEEKNTGDAAPDFLGSAQEKTDNDLSNQSAENEIVLKDLYDLPEQENQTDDADKKSISDTNDDLLPDILPGMSDDDVLEKLGQPDESFVWYTGQSRLKYGDVWVVIENNAVTCLVGDEKYEKFWGRKKYESYAPEAIIR